MKMCLKFLEELSDSFLAYLGDLRDLFRDILRAIFNLAGCDDLDLCGGRGSETVGAE